MGLFGKKHNKNCCCGDVGCVGCCFCKQTPAVNADYIIDAPSCALLNGQTGNVSGPAPSSETDTTCGACVPLENNASGYSLPQYAWDDSMPPDCIPQFDSDFQFSFYIRCEVNENPDETDPLTTEVCCRNIRLIITDGAHSVTPKIGTVPIPPSSCSCDPFMAIFPLAGAYPDCGAGNYVGGPCDGKTKCSQLGCPACTPSVSCSIGDATVTFTQSGCP